jgi:hypothetical protein
MARFDENMERMQHKLDALILLVDGVIRDGGKTE